MTPPEEIVLKVNKLVVVVDICSSTTILERLKQIDRQDVWRNFLIRFKNALLLEGQKFGIELYNFTGDGWILLFPDSIPTDSICRFLKAMSIPFDFEFRESIRPLLGISISPVGLTFGIDSGELVSLIMNDRTEYLGRAINVACRLQSSAKDFKDGPAYKAVFSANSFNRPLLERPATQAQSVILPVRNSNPPNAECFIVETYCPDEPDLTGGMNALAGLVKPSSLRRP